MQIDCQPTDASLSTQEADRRAAFIRSLRDAAQFLEDHPAVKAPRYVTMNVFVNTRDEIADQARAASWLKDYNDTWFNLRRQFGEDLSIEINASRETVCRKVVTGTRVVPARPECVVDVYEWECDDPALLHGGAR
jgi:hypothetical protein